MKDLINLTQYADALRSTGYKNIESAISEIVDNSVEAGAKDIFIILKETLDEIEGKKKITEIAFLDNGIGMDKDTLESSLRIGCGTRTDRKGIGRFGVGLPQASMHVAPKVDVYSWRDYEENPLKVYLDIDKVRSGEQTGINDAESTQVPEEYKSLLSFPLNGEIVSFKKSGTLVVWKECDNVSPKSFTRLEEKLSFELGKKFRYFIHNNQCRIVIIDINSTATPTVIKPNDPLMLMDDNRVLGSPDSPCEKPDESGYLEPIFEPFQDKDGELEDGNMSIPYEYYDRKSGDIKTSNIAIRCSIVKEEYYDLTHVPAGKNPGTLYYGKEVKKVEGISIVRANREVDFGRFDFYSVINEPVHRWWGIEIKFNTELDEVFGVSNNKQHVELRKLELSDYSEERMQPIWLVLEPKVSKLISEMKARNKELRKAIKTTTKTGENIKKDKSVDIIEKNSIAEVETFTANKQERDYECVKKEAEKIAKEIFKDKDDITDQVIEDIIDSKANFIYTKLDDTGAAFEFDVENGLALCKINTNHLFYKKFIKECNDNTNLTICFELLLGAFLRVVDTLQTEDKISEVKEIVKEWNRKLSIYMNTYEKE